MRKRIGQTSEDLPVIGLGTWQTFDVGAASSERAPLEGVLGEFTALGGRLIDSSPMYGQSERVAGDIAGKLGVQKQLFVATKVWTTGRDAGIRQMEASMASLRAPRIDLMQVHNLVDASTHLPVLHDWRRAGRIRFVGITHYHRGAYAEVEQVMRTETIDFLQINYSVLEREAEKLLLPLAMEKGIAVIANRPLASGSLFGRLKGKRLPAWAAEIDCSSWAQLLLKFVVSHPAITCVIPATSRIEHLRDNMAAGYGRMPDAKLRERIARELA